MNRNGGKSWWTEVWAFVAIAAIAFVGGLLIGDLGGSPETKTVYLSASESEEAAATETAEAEEPAPSGEGGAQLFTSIGCGGCHTLAAAGTTGETGPNLGESLAPDDNTAGIEEMILHPDEEVVEGYPPNVMPQNYGESLSPTEVKELSEFLVASTPAKP
ncbi:MAG TPA: c-type cytochrome [Solirubrobacterales bacterium]|nr:c-type cytochrome [Solirubrobacterales bacterium]